MLATNLSFAKVVATPTIAAWSQAYNAGSLFIALSLSTDDETLQPELPAQGKQILNNIEAEVFVLSTKDKNLQSIQDAVKQAIKDIPETIVLSLTFAFVKEDILYCFIIGSGRITLKRGEQVGTLLHKKPSDSSRELISASGYLETDDIILLETQSFAQSVPAKTINQAFEFSLPSDIAETISPHVHGGSEGGASAIVISYKGAPRIQDDEQEEIMQATQPSPPPIHHSPLAQEREDSDEIEEKESGISLTSKLRSVLSSLPIPHLQLDPRRRVILSLALIILGILLLSIFFVRSTQQSSKNKALFEEIYTSAKKDYDEGESLLTLNKSLARDDYQAAKQTLQKADGKFEEGSEEAKKIAELTSLVDQRLSETEGVTKVSVKEASEEDAPVLAALKNKDVIAAAQDEEAIYKLSQKELSKIDKSSEDEETLIENDDLWTKPVGLDDFSGNLYVLDQEEGLIKFVPTASGLTPTTYFTSNPPDLKNAISLSIDSSIYILFSDGSIQKYTRGTKADFSISGLEKDFRTPKAIYTSPDLSNIYVLDSGTNRIVKLSNSGEFQGEYQTDILKNAKAFTISNDEKSAFVLSGDKIYQFGL